MKRASLTLGLMVLMLSLELAATEAVERRRDQFGAESSHYIYPIAGDIPGLGVAAGVGVSLLNMFSGDADFTGYYVRGDFNATGATFLNMHLLPRRLIFDVGYNDFLVAPIQYNRGILSDPDDFILPKAEGRYLLGQMTLSFAERRYEFYLRGLYGDSRLLQVLDRDGKPFESIDQGRHVQRGYTLGLTVDLTDDRLDPRQGFRFEAARKAPSNGDHLQSDFYVMDYNLTAYLPLRRWDTLVFNGFYSEATVSRQAETDFAVLQQHMGLGCDQIASAAERQDCLETERRFIDQQIAANRYGIATSLGGTQRLRSFANGRFYAGSALFYGIEYRWNLTDEYTPFDLGVAKGIRTGLQLAFFAEQGSVADRRNELFKHRRSSYGAGFRVVLTGVIIRADYATGSEGNEFQLFITYPWSMFSVDNPG